MAKAAPGRVAAIVLKSSEPRDRSSRRSPDTAMPCSSSTSPRAIAFTTNVVLQLHGMLFRYLHQDGGRWKATDNEILQRWPEWWCHPRSLDPPPLWPRRPWKISPEITAAPWTRSRSSRSSSSRSPSSTSSASTRSGTATGARRRLLEPAAPVPLPVRRRPLRQSRTASWRNPKETYYEAL